MKVFINFLKLTVKTLPLFWESSRIYTLILLFILPLQGILPALSLWFAKGIIDEISLGGEMNLASLLFLLFILWMIVAFISSILSPLEMTFQGLMTDKLIAHINIMLMNKSAELHDITYFEDPSFHDDIQIIEQEAAWRPVNLMVFIAGVIRNTITGISMVLLLISFHPFISLIIFICILPQGLVTYRLQKEAFETLVIRSPEARKMRYYSSVMLSQEHAKEVRIFNLGDFFITKYKDAFTTIHKDVKKIRYKQVSYSTGLVTLGIIGIGLCFWWVLNASIRGVFTPGDILLFSSSILIARQSLSGIIEESSMLYDTLLYMQKFFGFLALEPKIQSGKKKLSVKETNFEIVFNNISFKYPNSEKYVLKNVNFTLNIGEKIGIVGENGAGKSTIVKLITRLYEPTSGKILLNGEDISKYDLKSYRENIAIVFQDFSKYQLTMKENIVLSKLEDINRSEKLQKVIDKTQLSGLVDSFPNGLDQMISKSFENGTDLSGGQWQKLAIARAYFRDAPFIILDEPSASLDARNEHKLLESFIDLASKKTLLLITHKLSALKMVDKILFLKDGSIVEEGSHSELMQKDGQYAELYKLQAEKYHI